MGLSGVIVYGGSQHGRPTRPVKVTKGENEEKQDTKGDARHLVTAEAVV